MTESNLHLWYQSPLGRLVLEKEQELLDGVVANVFGFNAVQVALPTLDPLRTSRIPHRLTLGVDQGNNLAALPEAMPLATQSVDLVVLPHALEFSDNPHAILREAHRILMPEGRLVITGFNPNSLWGLAQYFSNRSQFPWRGRFLSVHRVRDWLALLDFEVTGGRFWAYTPPFKTERWLQRFAFMEQAGDRWWGVGGGVYMLEAIKRVQGVRLITPRWQPGLGKVLAPSRPTGHAHDVQKKVING